MLKRLFLFLIFLSKSLIADEYAVISNPQFSDLSPTQIKAIFLKKMTHINKLHIVPLNLSHDDPLRKKFEKEVLHMSFQRLKSYWIAQHYLGKRPPLSMKSQKSALLFTLKVQGAITYMNMKNITGPVKILYTWKDK